MLSRRRKAKNLVSRIHIDTECSILYSSESTQKAVQHTPPLPPSHLPYAHKLSFPFAGKLDNFSKGTLPPEHHKGACCSLAAAEMLAYKKKKVSSLYMASSGNAGEEQDATDGDTKEKKIVVRVRWEEETHDRGEKKRQEG